MSRGPFPAYRHSAPHYRTPGRAVAILGVAATTVYVNDTFTRTVGPPLGTSDSGHVWSNINNNFSTNGTEALTSAGGNAGEWIDSGQSNCYVETVISVMATEWAVVGRSVNGDPLSDSIVLILSAPTTAVLRKYNAFTGTNLGVYTTPTHANGDSLGIRFNGSTISAYHNGVLLGSVTETDHQTNTRHGLVKLGAGTAGRWTSFRVTS